MGLVLRYQWESYMDCRDYSGAPDYQLIGDGFTSFPESKNPKKYVRKYHENNTTETDVIGYAPSISYSCDLLTDNPVVRKIAEITDQEYIGVRTRVDIVSVNLWEETDTVGIYVAYKRTFSVVPDGKGDGTDAMIYTGSLQAAGDAVPGTFNRTTKTFTPNEPEGNDDDIAMPFALCEKTVTPTFNAQEVTPKEGYYGLRRVTVEAFPLEEFEKELNDARAQLNTVGTPGLSFALSGDGTGYTCISFSSATKFAYVHIPSVYEGKPVNKIGTGSFYYCTSVTSISIPYSVTSIAKSAFVCPNMTSISIPYSVTSIGSNAFSGCAILSYNEYDNAYYLGNSNNPYVALIKTKSNDIESCTIHEKTKVIGEIAFYGLYKLTSVTFLCSKTNISNFSFQACNNLVDIYVPWAEGDVAGAPWGATNATIHYNSEV